jgi:hypothetical protein
MLSEDGMCPDNLQRTHLGPVVVIPACLPFNVRRSILAGEHVQLSPDLQKGKINSASLTRDARRAEQEAFGVFVDEANFLHPRGLLLHGSHIKNCPHNSDECLPILVKPFIVGGGFDALGAYERLNLKQLHCTCCPAGYHDSWRHPDVGALLPLAEVEPAAGFRRIANDPLATPSARLDARRELDELHVNPELTSWDTLAAVHMEGKRCVVPDTFHCCELGCCKCSVFGVKLLCSAKITVSGRGHSISSAKELLNDFVAFGGINLGYHMLPVVRDFTSVQLYTGMMIRSLLFSLLAAFVSIEDLFNDTRQTALINNFVAEIVLLRHVNSHDWESSTPDFVSSLYEFLEEHWDDALGGFVRYMRPKVHFPSHWRQTSPELGAPVHWSTQHAIEALQRILKAAWRFTNKVNPSEQVLRRIMCLRYIVGTLLPAYGVYPDPVAALAEDKQTQAFLTGNVDAVVGITSLFANAASEPARNADKSLKKALKDAEIVWVDNDGEQHELPRSHVFTNRRVYCRRAGFFSREGVCAVSVPAYPLGAAESEQFCAIFSMYEAAPAPAAAAAGVAAAGVAAAAAGVAAAAVPDPPPVESSTDRFFVQGWMSYDISGLTGDDANAVVGKRLTVSEQNSSRCVDLAVGRRAVVLPSVCPTSLARNSVAERVFQRVKLSQRLEIVDIGRLCQPLLSYPYLGDVANARKFYHKSPSSKWDHAAEPANSVWLVCPKLY